VRQHNPTAHGRAWLSRGRAARVCAAISGDAFSFARAPPVSRFRRSAAPILPGQFIEGVIFQGRHGRRFARRWGEMARRSQGISHRLIQTGVWRERLSNRSGRSKRCADGVLTDIGCSGRFAEGKCCKLVGIVSAEWIGARGRIGRRILDGRIVGRKNREQEFVRRGNRRRRRMSEGE